MMILYGASRRLPASIQRLLSADFGAGASVGTSGAGVAFSSVGLDPSAAVGHTTVTVRYRGSAIPIILGHKE